MHETNYHPDYSRLRVPNHVRDFLLTLNPFHNTFTENQVLTLQDMMEHPEMAQISIQESAHRLHSQLTHPDFHNFFVRDRFYDIQLALDDRYADMQREHLSVFALGPLIYNTPNVGGLTLLFTNQTENRTEIAPLVKDFGEGLRGKWETMIYPGNSIHVEHRAYDSFETIRRKLRRIPVGEYKTYENCRMINQAAEHAAVILGGVPLFAPEHGLELLHNYSEVALVRQQAWDFTIQPFMGALTALHLRNAVQSYYHPKKNRDRPDLGNENV